MEQQPVFLPPGTLRSPFLYAAAILYGFAGLLGIPGVILLFSESYAQFLLQDLISGGITDPSSLLSWRIINSAVTGLACCGPCIMTAGFLQMHRGKPLRGVNFLGTCAHICLWGVNISGAAALCILIFRLIRYIIVCIQSAKGLMLFYSMVISEALMISQAVFLFVLLRKFLNCCIDSCTSIAYTLATGKLDDRSIPGLAATGFLLLAFFGVGLSINRLFTLTIVYRTIGSYYRLLVASHPAQLAEIACLLCGSAANILVFRYLKQHKRNTEKALFDAKGFRK